MRVGLVEAIDEKTAAYRLDLGARLDQVVKIIGKKSTAAEIAGVTPEQLDKWLKGTVKVPAEAIRAIAEAADVDFSWTVTGRGDMSGSSVDDGRSSLTDLDQYGMIRLPIYREVQASAGLGATMVSERADGVMSFDPRFLRDQGAVPEKCSVIWAHGDSMTPTIPDGSALIVDRSQTEVKNGSIMVIGVDDDLLVKRVRRRLDGLIDLISDNSAYAPETLGPAALQQLRVVGRVVYFCRTP